MICSPIISKKDQAVKLHKFTMHLVRALDSNLFDETITRVLRNIRDNWKVRYLQFCQVRRDCGSPTLWELRVTCSGNLETVGHSSL